MTGHPELMAKLRAEVAAFDRPMLYEEKVIAVQQAIEYAATREEAFEVVKEILDRP